MIGYRLLMVDKRLAAERSLPGTELVEKGLADLAAGAVTVESLLVSIGAPRLRRLGLAVPPALEYPEERLYLLLARDDPDGAHARHHALVRRLVSFERAAESAH
ncbi:MAG TPA: hypothetical protein VFJ93_14145 [Gaiellaceae bacterium]|nr:hypothetical protein [Gaiellaceae bacterium]